MREFKSPDGTPWTIDVGPPGSSNVSVIFRHPDGRTARLDRYAWYISRGPEAQDVTKRLDRRAVLDALSDDDLRRLFRRSMPVTTPRAGMPVSPLSRR